MAAADELLQHYITDATRMHCYSAIKSLIQRLQKLFHDCYFSILGGSLFTFSSPADSNPPRLHSIFSSRLINICDEIDKNRY